MTPMDLEYLFVHAVCPCGGLRYQPDSPRYLSWECGHCGARRCVRLEDLAVVAWLKAEVAQLRAEMREQIHHDAR